MRVQAIVALRVLVVSLVMGVVIALFSGWEANLWNLLIGIPAIAAWLTLVLDRQAPGELLLRAPVRRLLVSEIGCAQAETVAWPREDQERLHEYASLCAAAYEGDRALAPSSWTLTLASTDREAPRAKRSTWWQISTGGLHWEIWHHQEHALSAIVFRGTEFRRLSDWLSNARWFIGWFTYDQYDEVRDIADKLVQHAQSKFETPKGGKIVATGHSLGGGLAQQLAYVAPNVKLVYAFQTTPVTGFHSVPSANRLEATKGLRIYRLFEHGEVLAYVRWIIRAFLPLSDKSPRIVEGRYDFGASMSLLAMVQQHSMADFAKHLGAAAGSKANDEPGGNLHQRKVQADGHYASQDQA